MSPHTAHTCANMVAHAEPWVALPQAYFSQIPGKYFTGDGARIDDDGDVWILGRTDDVLNVSGHRLSTAEVGVAGGWESALGVPWWC